MIRTAPAKITGHAIDDFLLGRMWRFGQQSHGLHDLSGLAVPALRNIFSNPGLLNRMQTRLRESFNSCDCFGCRRRNGCDARTCGLAVKMYGAGTANACSTTIFCASEFECVTDQPEKRGIGIDVDLAFCSIDTQREFGHEGYRRSLNRLASDGKGKFQKGKPGRDDDALNMCQARPASRYTIFI